MSCYTLLGNTGCSLFTRKLIELKPKCLFKSRLWKKNWKFQPRIFPDSTPTSAPFCQFSTALNGTHHWIPIHFYINKTIYHWFLPGIGKATALRLAKAGAVVIATDISEEALKSLDAIKGNKST